MGVINTAAAIERQKISDFLQMNTLYPSRARDNRESIKGAKIARKSTEICIRSLTMVASVVTSNAYE